MSFDIDMDFHISWYRCKSCFMIFTDGSKKCPMCNSYNVERIKFGGL